MPEIVALKLEPMSIFRVAAALWVAGWLLSASGPVAATTFTVASQTSCASGEYYDIASFSCVACDATQDVTSDGFGCVCKAGYIRDFSGTGTSAPNPPCTKCAQASSSDRYHCMTCDGTTTGYDTSTLECGCAASLGLVEVDLSGVIQSAKSCITCTAGSYLHNGVCTACADPYMQASAGTCACSAAYTQVNDVCLNTATYNDIQTTYPASSAYTVKYNDVESAAGGSTTSVTSAVLSQWFYEAAVKCKRQAGVEWCQMLANMCVLQMYETSASACALFISLTTALTTHGFQGWGSTYGYLYLATTTLLTDASSSAISTSFSYSRTTSPYTDTITMRLASYAFNGTFLGWSDLTTQLALCGGEYDNLMKWTSFGEVHRET